MKAEQFSNSLNNIQDRYIEEAIHYGSRSTQNTNTAQQDRVNTAANRNPGPIPMQNPQPPKRKPPKSTRIWRAIAIAACALLAVGVGVSVIGLIANSSRSSYYYEENVTADSYDSGIYSGEAAYDGEKNAIEETVPAGDIVSNEAEAAGSGSAGMPVDANARIIYTASLKISTTEFADAQELIEAAAEKYGGYFETVDIENHSASYQTAYYQIRIPAESMDLFLKEAESFGAVSSVNRSAQDVSDSYYDIESRLETARTKLARLQELLSQAQNMSDIITIENEISNVEWEIDSLTGDLNYYDSQITYSTVSISLEEVYRVEEAEAPLTFGQKISQAFHDGLSSFTNAMENVLVWLAESWIWVLIIAAVFTAGIIILVKFEKKNR